MERQSSAPAATKAATPEPPKKAARAQSVQLLPLAVKSATTAGLLLAVWGAGFMHLGVSWVIGASALYLVGREYRKSNKAREEEVRAAEEPTLARVDELPTWVYFPDVERAEWLNKVVQQMWPYIGENVARIVKGFEEQVGSSVPRIFAPFRFEEISLGEIPPRLGGIKVYIDNVKRDEIVMDAEFSYAGDSEFDVSVRGLHAGIKDVMLHGVVRIIFRPLINKMPLFGGFEFCFLNSPNIDFDFTNFANVLDVPFLNDSLRKVIADQVSNRFVLPNVVRIDFASSPLTTFCQKEFSLPVAVARITMVEADDLKRADMGKIFGKGKSDPYCKVAVGGVTHSTRYIESTVRPRWDETFEFVINNLSDQEMEINVYDHDDHVNDDFIGNTYIRMEDLALAKHMDEWIRLSNVKTGRLHVMADVFFFTGNADDPNRLKDNSDSTAVLFVTVESARDLPSHSKGLVEPSPCVFLQLGNASHRSASKSKTINPLWNEHFHFFVKEPENETLVLQVLDSNKADELMGKVNFKLNKILSDEGLLICQPFALDNTTTSCSITLRLCLRFLTTTVPEVSESPTVSEENTSLNAAKGDGGTAKELVPGPKKESESKTRYRGRQASTEGKHGRIQLTLRYNQEKEKVIVTVQKCLNLKAYDKDNFSDPYVRLYLLPDRSSSSKKKTNVMKNNLNPVWDESFEWPLKKEDIGNRTLEVMVKNFIGVFEKKTKTEMGVVNLSLYDFDNLSQPVSDWFDLQDPESLTSEASLIF